MQSHSYRNLFRSLIAFHVIFAILSLLGCSTAEIEKKTVSSELSTQTPMDQRFQVIREEFISEYLRLNPVIASSLGEHRYDSKWTDISREGEAELLRFHQKIRQALQGIDRKQLNDDNRVDAAVLTNHLEAEAFTIQQLAPYENSAMASIALMSSGLDILISNEFAAPDIRVKSLIERLKGLPQLIKNAELRLRQPSRLDAETALSQVKGLAGLCKAGLDPLLKQVPDKAGELKLAAQDAYKSMMQMEKFLRTKILPQSNRDFRLGAALYTRKMQLDLVDDIAPESLAREARLALDRTLDDMYQVALQLSPQLLGHKSLASQNTIERKKLIRAVLDKIATEQPTDSSFFKDAESAIQAATQFIQEKDFLTIPKESCKVIKMPSFNSGFAGAYSQSSGPFEAKFENFVALELPSPAERASFYREYNNSMLVELMLHEAMPGHCLQAMHAARSPHPLRSMLGNGPYAEGWAMYIEEVMADHGFGGPKIKMMQLKLLARAIANTLLDYGVHVQNMSEKEAMHLLMDETFQERSEALGKWRRVQLSSVQLTTYFYGYQQFVAMRKAAEKKTPFQEKSFHDQLLDSGAPPLKLLRSRYGI